MSSATALRKLRVGFKTSCTRLGITVYLAKSVNGHVGLRAVADFT